MIPWRGYGSQGGALSRRDPLSLFRTQLDALFNRFFGPLAGEEEFGANWGMDMTEDDKEVVVRVELPGFEPEDIDVRVSGDTLTIQAEHAQGKEGRQEEAGRWYRSFRGSITLEAHLDTSKVEVTYRNGVLEVHLPRSEQARPRRIEVRREGRPAERPAGQTQPAGKATPTGPGNGNGGQGKTSTAEKAGARK
jgi:HSP20 family protein